MSPTFGKGSSTTSYSMGNHVCCSADEDEEALIPGGEFIYTATLDDYYKNDKANNINTLSLHDDDDDKVGSIDHKCRQQRSSSSDYENNKRRMNSMMDTPFDERLSKEDEEDDEEGDVVVRPPVSSTSILLQPPPLPMPPNNNNDNNKRNNNDDRNTKIRTDVINDSVVHCINDQPVSTKRDDTTSSIFLTTTNVTSLYITGVGGDCTVKDKMIEKVRTKDNDTRLARYQRVRNFALWKDNMKRNTLTNEMTMKAITATCKNSSGSKVLSSTKSSTTTQRNIALAPTFTSSYDDDDDDYNEHPAIRFPSDEELKDFDFLVQLA